MSSLLAIHVLATWFMVGLIWTIQWVHYPLFASVGRDHFVRYERNHTKRMATLLVVPALVEVATSVGLIWIPPPGVGRGVLVAAAGLLLAIWIATALVYAPVHGALSGGHDARLIRRLEIMNWWRTAAWTARGAIVAAVII